MIIRFHRKFEKQVLKLKKQVYSSLESRIRLFMKDPFNVLLNNHPLTGKYKGYRSINITGDYRAIFLPTSDKEVVFVAIGTHNKLYK